MARRRRRRKGAPTAQQRRFGAASRVCMATSGSFKSFGTCMRGELKGRGRRKRR